MCGGAKSSGGAAAAQQQADAEAARVKEEERQARIRQGRGNIDAAFAGFDEPYYQRYRDSFLDAALPQVQDQANDARTDLVYALERAGLRNSSVAGSRGGDLERDIALRTGEQVSAADSAAQGLRGRVADSRAAAERDLMLVEDPTRAANDATARTQVLAADSSSPGTIGPLFESAALGWNAYQQGSRQVRADAAAARLLNNTQTAQRIGG